jgi:hypothetical protein
MGEGYSYLPRGVYPVICLPGIEGGDTLRGIQKEDAGYGRGIQL